MERDKGNLTQNRKSVARADQRLVSMADWLDFRGTRKDPPKKMRKIKHQTTPQRLSKNPTITTTTKKNNPTHQQRGKGAPRSCFFTWYDNEPTGIVGLTNIIGHFARNFTSVVFCDIGEHEDFHVRAVYARALGGAAMRDKNTHMGTCYNILTEQNRRDHHPLTRVLLQGFRLCKI